MDPIAIRLDERLGIARDDLDVRLKAIIRAPTAVMWNRLEGRPRSDDLTRPLRAEVRDPAWMLARQWQFGEFEGQDAGAPIQAKFFAETQSLEENPAENGTLLPYDPKTPLEVLVERQPVEPDLIMGLYVGRKWLRKLATEFGDGNPIIQSFRDAYAVTAPADNTLAALQVKSNPEELRLRRSLAPRSLDGAALLLDIRKAVADASSSTDVFIQRGITIAAGSIATVNNIARELLAQFDGMFSDATATNPTWQPTRLEHKFSLQLTESPTAQTKLLADQFPGGSLDWYSFDVALPRPTQTERQGDLKQVFIPTPVTFFGMPNVRWWEFEGQEVGFGLTTASKSDLVKMLLAEFGLVFSNDWFILPLNIKTGNLVDTNGIVVTDNFGFNTLVEPMAKRHRELRLAGNWTMWTLSVHGQPGQVDSRFFLAPTANRTVESRNVDEVLFLRDEMANLVWGVETVIPNPMGGGRDGRFAANLMSKTVQQAFPVEPLAEVERVPIRYQLMGSVPENWIPLAAVQAQGETTATLLLQGAVPRVPAIEPTTRNGAPILENNVVLPRGAILSSDPVSKPNVILEEEILRDGILVRRRFRQTRWLGGRTFTWIGYEKRNGRGEGSSAIKFDQVIEKRPRG